MLFIEMLVDREPFLPGALPSLDEVFYDHHPPRPLENGTGRVAMSLTAQDVVTIQSTCSRSVPSPRNRTSREHQRHTIVPPPIKSAPSMTSPFRPDQDVSKDA